MIPGGEATQTPSAVRVMVVYGSLDAPHSRALDTRRRSLRGMARLVAERGMTPEYPWESPAIVVNGRSVVPYALVDAAWLAEHPEYTHALREALHKARPAN